MIFCLAPIGAYLLPMAASFKTRPRFYCKHTNTHEMELECTCMTISADEWAQKMKDARPISYKWLVGKIRKNMPELYDALALQFPNPYDQNCAVNRDYYILVHSAIEYFIRKH